QSHYRRRPFMWREAGGNARGRAIKTRFGLDKNCRKTPEILKGAGNFVLPNGEQKGPPGPPVVKPNPYLAPRSRSRPEMLAASSAEGELEVAVKKVLAWREQGLKPSEIAVLYRANTEGGIKELASAISMHTAVYWPHDQSGNFVDPAGVCVRTMHSAKG